MGADDENERAAAVLGEIENLLTGLRGARRPSSDRPPTTTHEVDEAHLRRAKEILASIQRARQHLTSQRPQS